MNDQVALPVHPLAQGLNDQVSSITVDNQPGKKVGFGENQAAGGGILNHTLPMPDCRGQPAAKEFLIDRFWLGGEQAQSDLRGGAVMRNSNRPAALVGDLNDIARLSVAALRHIARKNPRVAAGGATGGFLIHANSGQPAILA